MHHLTKAEMNGLLAAAKKASARDYAMILLGYTHGLRASEIISLTSENIRDGYLTVARLKGSLKTTQPLSAEEQKALAALGVTEGPLFGVTRRTLDRKMKQYGAEAGIPEHKCHAHILKHSVAMHSIQKAGIENVRQYLGHKSLSSTGAYLKVDDEAASKAVLTAMGVK